MKRKPHMVEHTCPACAVGRVCPLDRVKAERDLLRRIAGQACLRIAGLEIIISRLKAKGRLPAVQTRKMR